MKKVLKLMPFVVAVGFIVLLFIHKADDVA